MTGFFNGPSKGKIAIDNGDLARATRLLKVLIAARRTSEGNPKAWADEFRKLRKTVSPEQIDQVLGWLEIHIAEKYTPKVFSAQSFRKKFPQLIEAMGREETGWPPDLPISDDARKIAVRLGGLYWPKGEKPDELKLIQASLDGHKAWMNLCRQAKVKHPDQAGLIDCLLAFGGDSNDFVEHWVASVHRIAWTNEQWAGKLVRHAATMKHPRFQKIVAGWICEYKGEGDWWSWFETLLQGDGK